MFLHFYLYPVLAHCNFDKRPTLSIVLFELVILAGAAFTVFILPKIKDIPDQVWLRFLVMAVGVFIFELFTAPMWNNQRMGWWAYVYHDVSWILTLGWTSLILGVVLLVEKFLASWKEWQRFPVYLAILMLLIVPLEILVVNLGIRSYAPEVLETVDGISIGRVPIEILYYIPVFTGLIVCFYKYWSFTIDNDPLVPLKKRKWGRSVILAFLGIFLFEVMIEPMVKNQKFPQWSYIFHDISIILIGLWILIIGLAAAVVTKLFMNYPTIYRFLSAIGIATTVALPLEAWLILNGYRVYSPSTVKLYTGFVTPLANIPVEVVFAIPCYMALIIAFIRYWETIMDNQL